MLLINQNDGWKWIVRFVRLKINLKCGFVTKMMFERMKVNTGISKIKFESQIFE